MTTIIGGWEITTSYRDRGIHRWRAQRGDVVHGLYIEYRPEHSDNGDLVYVPGALYVEVGSLSCYAADWARAIDILNAS